MEFNAATETRLFLVEDSPQIRERLLALFATVEGVRTVGYADGADAAIHDILAARPHAVVLDVSLAQGSGIDVLRALKAQAPEIDVYMLTNFATPQYRRLCARMGARGFFDKTTEFELVRNAIAARATRSVH
jgi:DNA-binding NarL/FixJ family response regulator